MYKNVDKYNSTKFNSKSMQETYLVMTLKKQLKEVKADGKGVEDQLKRIKKMMKFTKIKE